MIRFFGLEASLWKWREIVKEITGKEGGEILSVNGRHYFDVPLTSKDRGDLQMKAWHHHSGTGTDALNRPLRWNDCISFEEIGR